MCISMCITDKLAFILEVDHIQALLKSNHFHILAQSAWDAGSGFDISRMVPALRCNIFIALKFYSW